MNTISSLVGPAESNTKLFDSKPSIKFGGFLYHLLSFLIIHTPKWDTNLWDTLFNLGFSTEKGWHTPFDGGVGMRI